MLVSWQSFAEQTPGVVQWILQYKTDLLDGSYSEDKGQDVTLDAKVTNYTLTGESSIDNTRVLFVVNER